MPSLCRRLPGGIPLSLIEKCIPLKWKQKPNKERPLNVQTKCKPQSYIAHELITGLAEENDKSMVECLVITLKDFASQGYLSKAVRTFSLIQRHALASGSYEFVLESLSSLLKSCTDLKLLREGKQVHAQVVTWGLQQDFGLVPKLVSYYTTFDFFDDAHFIARRSNVPYSTTWNILIKSYANKECFDDAIFAYKEMCYKRIIPDDYTYPSILKACGGQSNLDLGRVVHKCIIASCLDQNLVVQNALVAMYEKCGDLESAKDVFDKIKDKDGVSWNSIISGYASRGKWEEAVELFESMRESGVEINFKTWNNITGGCLNTGDFRGALELIRQMRASGTHLDHVAVLNGLGACSRIHAQKLRINGLGACSRSHALKLGKELHGLAIRNSSVEYVNVKNALITLYSSCGDIMQAYIVFRSVEPKTVTTWNSMISGFAKLDRSEDASSVFRELLLTGIEPNSVTLAGILPLCARVANLQHGKEFHCFISRRAELHGHLLLWNALIDMYARSGKVSIARRLFDSLDTRDKVTYTSMIAGYGIQGEGKMAIELFEEMIQSGIKPDDVAMVAILSACSHSGLVAQGQLIFKRMQINYNMTPTLEHFACMVDLFGRAGFISKAKEIILTLPYKPTSEMWATLLGACRIHGDMDIGEWAAEKLLDMAPTNPGYYVLIANMYAAAGCWEKLGKVRSFMRGLGVRKDPGCALVDIGDGFCPFLVEDTSNSQSDEIYLLLGGLTEQMKDIDFVPFEDSELEDGIIFLD